MPLGIAGAASVLMLGFPLRSGDPGGELSVRVFIVAAIVLIALAAARGAGEQRSRTLVRAACAALVVTAVLVLSRVDPAGAILLGAAIGSLLWQNRLWTAAQPTALET